jgi:hypothetical protein
VKTDQVMVTVLPIPSVTAGDPQTICHGACTSLTATGNGVAYFWTPDSSLQTNSGATVLACPTESTHYIVTTYSAGGCSAKDTLLVNVLPEPAPVADAGPDQTICQGQSVVIGTPAQSGLVYSWSPTTPLTPNFYVAQPTALVFTATTFTLTVMDEVSGCSNMDMVTVTPVSITIDAGADLTVCKNSSAFLSTSVSSNTNTSAFEYSWSPSNQVENATFAYVNTLPLQSTQIFMVTTTDPVSGCSAMDAVMVTVDPTAMPEVEVPSSLEICTSDPVVFPLAPNPGYNYQWTLINDFGSNPVGISDPTIANPTITCDNCYADFILEISSIGGTGACATVSKSVNIVTGTPPSIFELSNKEICEGQSVTLSPSVFPNSVMYEWTPAVDLSDPAISNPVASPAFTQTYTLTATTLNYQTWTGDLVVVMSCKASASATVTVLPTPDVYAGPDIVFCDDNGTATQFQAVPVDNSLTYQWSPAFGLSNPNVARPFVFSNVDTSYVLSVRNAAGCEDRDTVRVLQADCNYAIGNRVWLDDGAGGGGYNDGSMAGAETGIPDVVVSLYKDPNGDGIITDAQLLRKDTTDADGYYLFQNLTPNMYYFIAVDSSNHRTGRPLADYQSSSGYAYGHIFSDLDDEGIDQFTGSFGTRSQVFLMPETGIPVFELDLGAQGNGNTTNDKANLTFDFSFIESCEIQIESVSASNCMNSTYNLTVVVSYDAPPIGNITVGTSNGSTLTLKQTGSPQTIVLHGLTADGVTGIDVSVSFYTDNTCIDTIIDAYDAPAACPLCVPVCGNTSAVKN